MSLQLGSAVIDLHSALEISQVYESLGGVVTQRMASGRGVRQQHWRKIRSRVQGSGWMPPALSELDYGAELVMRCIAPRVVASAGTVLTIPAARRSDTDYIPTGHAYVGETWVPTSVDLVGNIATLAVVAGAIRYAVWYYPEITVLADPPQETGDLSRADYGWSLTAEEV